MSFYFPEGSSQQFSTTFASAKTISALTNANPPVATCTAHGYTTDDEILLNTGWEDLTDSVARVTVIDANSFSIQGMDTTSTAFFPAGAGVGTAKKVSGWAAIPQVLTVTPSGGDPRFTEIQLLSRRNAVKVPTGFNAVGLVLSLAHDPANATFQSMLSIGRALTKCAFKQVINGGGSTYAYGFMATSEVPKMQANNANSVDCAISAVGRTISYAT